MNFPRSSGILLHPTSLPGAYGIGELGREAHAFADFLRDSGQHIWQVLPLGPTGFGDSPYQCFSAFAGNPLLISLEDLGFGDVRPPAFSVDEVDFGCVVPWKMAALEGAGCRFREKAPASERERFEAFCYTHSGWLDDFALFMALKQRDSSVVWSRWEKDIRARDPHAI